MSFTEDAVKAKLSALNETQDSIVSVAQWILFHRRHAPVTAKIWQARLTDSQASKRLNLIYLANEVIQQSKARKKDDFLVAFSPIIADATVTAFRGASGETQQKIRRVVDVWRQRNIFDAATQESIEKRVDALESGRKKPMLGGSLFGGSGGNGASASEVPTELQTLAQLQTTLTRAELGIQPAVSSSTAEYKSLISPGPDAEQRPTPLPKQAAQLAALQKSLASASEAVSASIAAREALVAELSKLVEQNQKAVAAEKEQLQDLNSKKPEAEQRRRDVEDQIMRGLGDIDDTQPALEAEAEDRPEMEPLTPPPVESFTPPPAPPAARAPDESDLPDQPLDALPIDEPPSLLSPSQATAIPALSPGKRDIGSSSLPGLDHGLNGSTSGAGTIKRRKTAHGPAHDDDEGYAGLVGDDDIDDEVRGLLS